MEYSLITFGKNVRTIREYWGLTQEEFKNLFNALNEYKAGHATISNIESGKSVKLDFIFDLAVMIGQKIDDLFSRRLSVEELPARSGLPPPLVFTDSEEKGSYKTKVDMFNLITRLELVEKTNLLRAGMLEELREELENLKKEVQQLKQKR